VPEKLSVYVLPRTTVVAVLLKINLVPEAERFFHSATIVPLFSCSVILTLSILVVPEAPMIVKSQIALLPEKAKLSVCVFVLMENGSIAIAADALTDKHTMEMPSTSSLKILFIFKSSVIKFEVYFCLYNKKRK
jgi:hypothetical protein